MSRIERALERAANIRTTPSKEKAGEKITPYVPEEREGIVFNPSNPCIVTAKDIHSPAAEEYRKLKTAVLRLTKGEFRNLIMVTSSLSGEGKSITSINLAITMAQELNQTVLLVDADLRRPTLHHYLNLTPKTGIADCLTDLIDAGDAIVKTGVPKLSFLGAGKQVDNPAELLSSYRMKELLDELKNRYRDRYVIIDTPPVLPFAETHALCSMVDGVLLVAREGSASPQDIREALDSLQGAYLLGTVYNGSTTASPLTRYGYYGYGYARKQGTEK